MIDKSVSELTEAQELRSIFRAQLLSLIWIGLAFIIFGRVVYVQLFQHEYYRDLADKQYVASTPASFDRGFVYFSSKKEESVSAAKLISTYRIAIDPSRLTNKDLIYKTISSRIKLSHDVFYAKASKTNDPYEEIATNVSSEDATFLQEKKLKGVIFVKDNKRFYPLNSVGAQVLGFVGNNGKVVKGQYGIEKYYDDVLARGENEKSINFFAELFADLDTSLVSNREKYIGDVTLTIDAEAERFLHQVLIETKATWKSDTIGGIIMDPKTGAIIAMDGLPSYDPNDFGNVDSPSVYTNQMISGVYEMGSIIKPLTMASALDAKAVTLDTKYDDKGFRDLNGYKVRNFDGKARGITGMQTILDKSLNVGIVFLVESLGAKKFQEYFKKFGIGEETGIDLPGEAGGLTKNLKSSVFVDNATAGFGQGIAITPIQTVRALSVLGNGGYLPSPHVADMILFKDGKVRKISNEPGERVISKETSETITRMLVHVVDTALKDGTYKMAHYSIAAKTGTAQMVKPGGGYYEDRYLHSFFGYFPAYEPRYIVFLFHTYPKGAEYASATLTDPFFKLVKFLISYYEIPPDR